MQLLKRTVSVTGLLYRPCQKIRHWVLLVLWPFPLVRVNGRGKLQTWVTGTPFLLFQPSGQSQEKKCQFSPVNRTRQTANWRTVVENEAPITPMPARRPLTKATWWYWNGPSKTRRSGPKRQKCIILARFVLKTSTAHLYHTKTSGLTVKDDHSYCRRDEKSLSMSLFSEGR